MGAESNTVVLFVIGVILEAIFVSWLLNRYSNPRKTVWYVSLLVWFGWFFSFAIVFFIPMDVSSGRHQSCAFLKGANITTTPEEGDNHVNHEFYIESCTVLSYVWRTLYWTTYILCWVVYPVLQSLVVAAHFTFYERLVRALKENIILYAAIGFIGLIGIIFLLATKRVNTGGLVGLAMAAGNIYGLSLLFLLESYGLIEIPKRLWHLRNRQVMLKSKHFKIVGLLREVEEAKKELEATLLQVKKYSDNVPAEDPFRPYIDTIVKKCPIQYNDLVGGKGDYELTYSKVVALHSRVIYANMGYSRARCLYETQLKQIYELEDKIHSESNSAARMMKWSFKDRKEMTPLRQIMYTLEWYYYTYIETKLYIIASGLCAFMSVAVVWSESVFWIGRGKFRLSIFYWIAFPTNVNVVLQWILIFIPVCYIAFTSYWTLYQLRLLNFYRILPHQQTDDYSILGNAYYVCRLTAPMVYNFLQMIDDDSSAFIQIMGPTPIFGVFFLDNAVLPLCLIVLCFCNLFNVWSSLLHWCACFPCFKKFKNFSYDEDFSDERIDQGREIVVEEKSLKERGLGLSIDQVRTPPSIKQSVKGYFSPSKLSFWKKKGKEDKLELLDMSAASFKTRSAHDA